MSDENDLRQDYVDAIATIWPNMQNNSIENINEYVIAAVDGALTSIQQCSKAMIGIDATFRIFYGATSWSDIIKNAKKAGKKIKEWLEVLNASRRYQICVSKAALQYRSVVEEALYGL